MSRGTVPYTHYSFSGTSAPCLLLVSLFVFLFVIPTLEADESVGVVAVAGSGVEDAQAATEAFAQAAAEALSQFGSFSVRVVNPEELDGAGYETRAGDAVTAATLDELGVDRLFRIEIRRLGPLYEVEVVMDAGTEPIRRTMTVFTPRTEHDAITKTEIVARGHARARLEDTRLEPDREPDAAVAAPKGVVAGQAALRATIAGMRPALLLGALASGRSTVSPIEDTRQGIVTGAADTLPRALIEEAVRGTDATAAAALGSFSLSPSPPPNGVLAGLSRARVSEQDAGGGNDDAALVNAGAAGDLASRTAEAVAAAAKDQATRRIPGELLVATNPRGATVFAGGSEVGTGPLLLRGVRQDELLIEARSGALYSQARVSVQPGIQTLTLTLEPTFSRLFLSSDTVSIEDAMVRIDGKPHGRVGDGLVSDVLIGVRRVVVKGDGLFWADNVDIPLGRTAEVAIEPIPVGEVRFSLPEGAAAVIRAVSPRSSTPLPEELQIPAELRGLGTLDAVPAGRYHVLVTGERYIPFDEEIVIEPGNSYSFAPTPHYTFDYFERVTTEEIVALETLIASQADIDAAIVERTSAVLDSIADSPHSVPELEFRAMMALRDAREKVERQRIDARLTELRRRRRILTDEVRILAEQTRRASTWRLVSLGGGIGSAGLWAIFTQAGNRAYTEYLTASVTEEAVRLRSAFRTWDALSYVAAGLGVVGIGAHVWLSLREPADREAVLELNGVEREIEGLEGRL